jgi:hypothetical protein
MTLLDFPTSISTLPTSSTFYHDRKCNKPNDFFAVWVKVEHLGRTIQLSVALQSLAEVVQPQRAIQGLVIWRGQSTSNLVRVLLQDRSLVFCPILRYSLGSLTLGDSNTSSRDEILRLPLHLHFSSCSFRAALSSSNADNSL